MAFVMESHIFWSRIITRETDFMSVWFEYFIRGNSFRGFYSSIRFLSFLPLNWNMDHVKFGLWRILLISILVPKQVFLKLLNNLIPLWILHKCSTQTNFKSKIDWFRFRNGVFGKWNDTFCMNSCVVFPLRHLWSVYRTFGQKMNFQSVCE